MGLALAATLFKAIPCIMAGSAVTGGLSMIFGCHLLAPHGGVFVLAIPNAVTHVVSYVIAIVAGTLFTTGALYAVKKPVADSAVEMTAAGESAAS